MIIGKLQYGKMFSHFQPSNGDLVEILGGENCKEEKDAPEFGMRKLSKVHKRPFKPFLPLCTKVYCILLHSCR